MLQIVPALLLLIIQGQTGIDRLAMHGRLPATLASLTAELQAVKDEDEQGENTIASLIALSKKNPCLSVAILDLLNSFNAEPTTTDSIDLQNEPIENEHISLDRASSSYSEVVLQTVSRFRDGPAIA